MRRPRRSRLTRPHRHIRLPADCIGLFFWRRARGSGRRPHGLMIGRLCGGLSVKPGLEPGENGFSGHLRLLRGPGCNRGGAYCGARVRGQQLAVAGRLGIARGYPRRGLRSTAAYNRMKFCVCLRLRIAGFLAAPVGGQTPVHFQLPRWCQFCLDGGGCAQCSSVPSDAVLRPANKPFAAVQVREPLVDRVVADVAFKREGRFRGDRLT